MTLTFLSAGLLRTEGAHPSRGLWVGEVALNAVNEATGAVGDSNTYEFSDPNFPTPTADTAFLRLILHVNGAGQVELLKSVAIVDGNGAGNDVLLITDPALYPEFPGIAKRIATAFYDFGDPQAVGAVQQLVDQATETAVAEVITGGTELSAVRDAVSAALDPIVASADVDSAYLSRGTGTSSFLTADFFNLAETQTLADSVAELIHEQSRVPSDFQYSDRTSVYAPFPSDPLGGEFSATVAAAEALRRASFYGDTRGIDAIVGIAVAAAEAVAALDGEGELAVKQAAARVAAEAAWHNAADLSQTFNRFLASDVFRNLPTAILPVAVQAAIQAEGRGENESGIVVAVRDALLIEASVQATYTEAETISSDSLWQDSRARRAVDALIDAGAESAAVGVLGGTTPSLLSETVSQALEDAMDAIQPAPVFSGSPSGAYSDFVTGASYQSAASEAAQAAASEAVFQARAGVTNEGELTYFTRRAVSQALRTERNQAAALPRHTVPLNGTLFAGQSIEGTIHLPALAPTNPFMHRLHPDHPEGLSIVRNISMTVDSPSDGGDFSQGGFGVSRLSGTYREEIHGLHKPLGNNQDIGLKTEGSFMLNRLTFVDTLNF